MKALYIIGLFGGGLLVGLALRGSETGCCKIVALAARDKVKGALGDTAANIGDLTNAWGLFPPILEYTGWTP